MENWVAEGCCWVVSDVVVSTLDVSTVSSTGLTEGCSEGDCCSFIPLAVFSAVSTGFATGSTKDCLWRTPPVASMTLLGTVLWSALTEEGFDFSADCPENLGSKQVTWPGCFLGSPWRHAGVLARLVPGVSKRLAGVSARLVPGVPWEAGRCTGQVGPWGPLGGR